MEGFVIFFVLIFFFLFGMILSAKADPSPGSITNQKKKQELSALKEQRHLSYSEYDELRSLEQDNLWLNFTRKEQEAFHQQYVAGYEREQPKDKSKDLEAIRKESPSEELPQLDILTSVEIAQATIKSFDGSRILAVADFLSGSDIQEAIESLHETLRPIYEDALIAHYQSNLGVADVKAEHIQPQIERCMEQGFKAILKLEELQGLWGEKPELGSNKQIVKKRTWKEISGEGG